MSNVAYYTVVVVRPVISTRSGTRQDVFVPGTCSGSRVHAVILHDNSDEMKKACIYVSASLSFVDVKSRLRGWWGVFSPSFAACFRSLFLSLIILAGMTECKMLQVQSTALLAIFFNRLCLSVSGVASRGKIALYTTSYEGPFSYWRAFFSQIFHLFFCKENRKHFKNLENEQSANYQGS